MSESKPVDKKSVLDISKTQVIYDHYLKKYQVFDAEEYEWLPYDPSSVPPPPPAPINEDPKRYFTILQRYQKFGEATSTLKLAECSKTLVHYFRTFIGGNWFNSNPEYGVVKLFPHLDEMKETLDKARLSLSEGRSREEKLDILQDLRRGDHSKESDEKINQFIEEFVEHFSVLMGFLEEQFKPIADRLALVTSYGHIAFDLLEFFFRPNQHLVTETMDVEGVVDMAFIVTGRSYHITNGEEFFLISGKSSKWDGKNFIECIVERTLRKFESTKPLTALPFRKITDEDREKLRARGKIYTSFLGVHYRTYKGQRVIVDYLASQNQSGYTRNPNQVFPQIKDNKLHLLPSYVQGFNLFTKSWTKFRVEMLQDVIFDENAWDHLVLDPDVKTLIKGLVDVTKNATSSSQIITDVITGKGGGLIAVLHGPPGTGKTLTAESVAEILHRPLYIVGSSELPSIASSLESRLKSILSLATAWDAVLLIDEADVYLEQRSLHELERNSLVSVALRVLEYHRGVLFLTTNRIKTFDEAFLSRFSIAIKYPELDHFGRAAVWSKFLKMAGCKIVSPDDMATDESAIVRKDDLNNLAAKVFNGRTIKNLVRTAQALALARREPLSLDHVMVVVRAQEKFLEQFSNA